MLFSLLNIGQRTVVGASWIYPWHDGEEMGKAEMIPDRHINVATDKSHNSRLPAFVSLQSQDAVVLK